jgi:hypothetical protein
MSWELHQMYREDEDRALQRPVAAAAADQHPGSSGGGAWAGRQTAGFTERDQERIALQAHAAAEARKGSGRTGLGFGSGSGARAGEATAPLAGGGAPALTAAERIRQKLQGGKKPAGSGGEAAHRQAPGQATARQLGQVARGDSELGRHSAAREWGRQDLHATTRSGPAPSGREQAAAAAPLIAAIDSDKVMSLNATDYQAYQRRRQQQERSSLEDQTIPADASARRSGTKPHLLRHFALKMIALPRQARDKHTGKALKTEMMRFLIEIAHHDAIFSASGSAVPTLSRPSSSCTEPAAAAAATGAGGSAADPRWEARVAAARSAAAGGHSQGAPGWKEEAISYAPRDGDYSPPPLPLLAIPASALAAAADEKFAARAM